MKIAKCLQIRYEEGGYYTTQHIKNGSRIKSTGNGYTQYPQGNGWAKNFKGSRLILYIEVDGNVYDTWIDQFFKDSIGKLTEKRRDIIERNMPISVEVDEYERQDGSKYYVVDEESLNKWLKVAGL